MGVHTNAPLGFNNLLELTELRQTFYLHLPVYYKGYNSKTAKLKSRIRQDVEGRVAQNLHAFSELTIFPAHVFANLEDLTTPSFKGF